MSSEIKKKLLVVGFLMTLLYSLHFAIPIYVNSIMLESFIGKKYTSLIITLGAICALFVTTHLGKSIKKYHNYNTTTAFVIINMITTFAIAFSNNGILTSFLYIIHFVGVVGMFVMLNLYIEEFSDLKEEGAVRGMFLTLLNTGILISPLIAGGLINNFGFSGVYIVSALCLFPIIFLLHKFYKNIKEPKYKNVNYLKAISEANENKNIKGALLALLTLESFYVLMSVYGGIYIVNELNIPISVYLGVIMPFALIPFVILPYGLGKLADIKTGEKELMLTGLIILIISTLIFINLETNKILYLAITLFISRLGASTLEAMISSYFFKKVPKEDAGLVALFGSIRTISFILVPMFGYIILILTNDIKYIFYAFLIFAIYILKPIFKIKDTK